MRKFIFGLAALLAVGIWAFVSCRDELVETIEERQSRASADVVADTITVSELDTVGNRADGWNITGNPIGFTVKTEEFNEIEIGL